MDNRQNRNILMIMVGYCVILLGFGLIAGDISESVSGFMRILCSPTQLTLDFFKIGTVGGTFINAGLVGLGCVLLYLLTRTNLNSVSMMCFFLTIGFSFFGINLLNMWPCILGALLYAVVKKEKFSTVTNVALFATSLAPFVSEGMWRYPISDVFVIKLLFGVLLGVICGFMMPILCKHSPNLHKGYTLYNAAAVAGLIALVLYSVLFKGLGVEAPVNTDLGDSQGVVVIFNFVLVLYALGWGLYLGGIKKYKDLLGHTGYGVDFVKEYGLGTVMINIAVSGVVAFGVYTLFGAKLTGPTCGCLICLLAVAPCGAHFLNVLPIAIGYFLASLFGAFELNAQAIIVGYCFACAMCPVSGKFGWLSGIVMGMLHALIVTSVVTFHGGFCLYNGGFTAGILMIVFAPVLECLFVPQDRIGLLPVWRKD